MRGSEPRDEQIGRQTSDVCAGHLYDGRQQEQRGSEEFSRAYPRNRGESTFHGRAGFQGRYFTMVRGNGQTGVYDAGRRRTLVYQEPQNEPTDFVGRSLGRGVFRNFAGSIWYLYSGRRSVETAEIPVVRRDAGRPNSVFQLDYREIYEDFDGQSGGCPKCGWWKKYIGTIMLRGCHTGNYLYDTYEGTAAPISRMYNIYVCII